MLAVAFKCILIVAVFSVFGLGLLIKNREIDL